MQKQQVIKNEVEERDVLVCEGEDLLGREGDNVE